MLKVVYLNLVLGLMSVTGVVLMLSGHGPSVLQSGKVFMAALHNSLYYLDQAKEEWAQKENKSEQDIPTLEDLKPYLAENANRIERLQALGIKYEITSMTEHQSDIATLTRAVRFRAAVTLRHFYPTGTRYCIHGFDNDSQWYSPPRGILSRLFQVLMIAIWAVGTRWSFQSIRAAMMARYGSSSAAWSILWTICSSLCLGVNGLVVSFLVHWFTGVA